MAADDKPYHAYGAAARCYASRSPEILMAAAAGTGKTRAILEKVLYVAGIYAGARILLTRQTRESMSETVLVTWERDVLDSKTRYVIGECSRKMRTTYEFKNGSSIVINGLDKPTKIMSADYDMVVVFEATETTEDSWEMLTTRLRSHVMPFQQAIADCNPAGPMHWLKRRSDSGKMIYLHGKHEDNPLLYDHFSAKWTPQGLDYLSKLDALTGSRKERLRHGRWVQSEGIVYEGWDPNIHVIRRSKLPGGRVPMHWRRFRVVDFGYVEPFVCQWWAVDEDGRMYLYREYVYTHRTVAQHIPIIKEMSAGDRIDATVADHQREDRETMSNEGIYSRIADKRKELGYKTVMERLKVAGDGRPRLFVLQDALVEHDPLMVEAKLPIGMIEEMDSYIWKPASPGHAAKEEALEKDDHSMDCLRYACMYADKTTGNKREFEVITPQMEV